jgi:hypothetical protein
MKTVRRAAVGLVLGAAVLFPAGVAAAAANPSGTGLPSQSCQTIGVTPGGSSSSPGSPFNEPGINSADGGIGGQHYNETSQYDVACYQVSQH